MEDITTNLSCLRDEVDEVGLPCDQQSWNAARALGLKKELTQHLMTLNCECHQLLYLQVQECHQDISCSHHGSKQISYNLAFRANNLCSSQTHHKSSFCLDTQEFNNPLIIGSRNMP